MSDMIESVIEIDNLHANLDFFVRITSDLVLSDSGALNYFVSYNGHIYHSEGELDTTTHETIGNVKFKIAQFGQSEKAGIDAHTFRSMCVGYDEFADILDANTMRLNKGFYKDLSQKPQNPNVLFVDHIEILPVYRGYEMTRKVLKLLLHHFKDACGLMLLEVLPYQYSKYYEQDQRLHPEKCVAMCYENFVDDYESAYLKLMHYFTQIGFRTSSLNSRVLFIETSVAEVSPSDFNIK